MPARVDCPCCGEAFEMEVDSSAGSQDFIEDCAVCCRPVEFRLTAGANMKDFTLSARRDDD